MWLQIALIVIGLLLGVVVAGQWHRLKAAQAPAVTAPDPLPDPVQDPVVTLTVTDTSSPITITGLNNGTAYNISVVAINGVGESVAAVASNIVPLAVPSVPTISVVATDGTASVTLTPSANDGGTPITSYKVIATPI